MPDHRTAHECVTSADGMPDEFPDNVPHNADLVYAIVHAMPDSGHAGQHGPQLWLHVALKRSVGSRLLLTPYLSLTASSGL